MGLESTANLLYHLFPNRELMDAALKEIVEKAKNAIRPDRTQKHQRPLLPLQSNQQIRPSKERNAKNLRPIHRQSNSTRHHPSQNP